MPGAQIHDTVERLPRPRQMPDCSSLLLVYMDTSDTTTENPEQIKDHKASGGRVRGLGAQVVFLLILTVTGEGPERSRLVSDCTAGITSKDSASFTMLSCLTAEKGGNPLDHERERTLWPCLLNC